MDYINNLFTIIISSSENDEHYLNFYNTSIQLLVANKNNLKISEEILEKLIYIYPSKYILYYYMGCIFKDTDKFKAMMWFKICYNMNPNYAENNVDLIKLLYENKYYENALELFNKLNNGTLVDTRIEKISTLVKIKLLKLSIPKVVHNDDEFCVYLKSKKKIISFSLYGSHEFYNYGALENAFLAKQLFDGWICRYYYDETVDIRIINALEKLDNTELFKVEISNMFYRFMPPFNENDIIFICRDTDSRLNYRDAELVTEWLKSDKDFHIIRDSNYHSYMIMGGMWGSRNNILHEYKNIYEKNLEESTKINNSVYYIDQEFLKNEIYFNVVHNTFIHDRIFNIENNTIINNNLLNENDYIGSLSFDATQSFNHLNEKNRLLKNART